VCVCVRATRVWVQHALPASLFTLPPSCGLSVVCAAAATGHQLPTLPPLEEEGRAKQAMPSPTPNRHLDGPLHLNSGACSLHPLLTPPSGNRSSSSSQVRHGGQPGLPPASRSPLGPGFTSAAPGWGQKRCAACVGCVGGCVGLRGARARAWAAPPMAEGAPRGPTHPPWASCPPCLVEWGTVGGG